MGVKKVWTLDGNLLSSFIYFTRYQARDNLYVSFNWAHFLAKSLVRFNDWHIFFIIKSIQKTFKIKLIYLLRSHADCNNFNIYWQKVNVGGFQVSNEKNNFSFLTISSSCTLYPFENPQFVKHYLKRER